MPPDEIADLLLRPLEAWKRFVGPDQPRMPPTFVVGPPRAGTTLPALHVLVSFEFAYVPQLSKRRRSPSLTRVRRALAAAGWTPSYENRYGEAEDDLAPSDAWGLFERYFGAYCEARAEDAVGARGLARRVAAFEQLFDAPFFVKNNANSMRVEALSALFPTALFVHVTRSLAESVASLLEARRRHATPLGQWWSAAPPQFLGRSFDDELEQAAVTVAGIDAYLRERLPRCSPGRHLEVDYERFCERPGDLTDWVVSRYAEAGIALRPRAGATPAARFEARRLPAERRAHLERGIAAALAKHGLPLA